MESTELNTNLENVTTKLVVLLQSSFFSGRHLDQTFEEFVEQHLEDIKTFGLDSMLLLHRSGVMIQDETVINN